MSRFWGEIAPNWIGAIGTIGGGFLLGWIARAVKPEGNDASSLGRRWAPLTVGPISTLLNGVVLSVYVWIQVGVPPEPPPIPDDVARGVFFDAVALAGSQAIGGSLLGPAVVDNAAKLPKPAAQRAYRSELVRVAIPDIDIDLSNSAPNSPETVSNLCAPERRPIDGGVEIPGRGVYLVTRATSRTLDDRASLTRTTGDVGYKYWPKDEVKIAMIRAVCRPVNFPATTLGKNGAETDATRMALFLVPSVDTWDRELYGLVIVTKLNRVIRMAFEEQWELTSKCPGRTKVCVREYSPT